MDPIPGLPKLPSFEEWAATRQQKRQSEVAQLSVPKPPRTENMAWYMKALDYLLRPGYATTGAIQAAIEGKDVGRAAYKGITGEKAYSWSDFLKRRGVTGVPGFVGGLAGDILTDPVTYLTFGAPAALKLGLKGGVAALPKFMALSPKGTKLLKDAVKIRAAEGVAGMAAREEGEHLMRFIVERDLIAKAGDHAGLARFDSYIAREAPGIPALYSKMEKLKLIDPALKPEAYVMPKGLKFSMPLVRDVIGEPRVFGGLDAKAVKAVGGAVASTFDAAKGLPVVGGAFKMTAKAAKAVGISLKDAFVNSSGSKAVEDIKTKYMAEAGAEGLKSQARIVELENRLRKLVGNDPEAMKAFEAKNNRILETVGTKIHPNMEQAEKALELEKGITRIEQDLDKAIRAIQTIEDKNIRIAEAQRIFEGKIPEMVSKRGDLSSFRNWKRMPELRMRAEERAIARKGMERDAFESTVRPEARRILDKFGGSMVEEIGVPPDFWKEVRKIKGQWNKIFTNTPLIRVKRNWGGVKLEEFARSFEGYTGIAVPKEHQGPRAFLDWLMEQQRISGYGMMGRNVVKEQQIQKLKEAIAAAERQGRAPVAPPSIIAKSAKKQLPQTDTEDLVKAAKEREDWPDMTPEVVREQEIWRLKQAIFVAKADLRDTSAMQKTLDKLQAQSPPSAGVQPSTVERAAEKPGRDVAVLQKALDKLQAVKKGKPKQYVPAEYKEAAKPDSEDLFEAAKQILLERGQKAAILKGERVTKEVAAKQRSLEPMYSTLMQHTKDKELAEAAAKRGIEERVDLSPEEIRAGKIRSDKRGAFDSDFVRWFEALPEAERIPAAIEREQYLETFGRAVDAKVFTRGDYRAGYVPHIIPSWMKPSIIWVADELKMADAIEGAAGKGIHGAPRLDERVINEAKLLDLLKGNRVRQEKFLDALQERLAKEAEIPESGVTPEMLVNAVNDLKLYITDPAQRLKIYTRRMDSTIARAQFQKEAVVNMAAHVINMKSARQIGADLVLPGDPRWQKAVDQEIKDALAHYEDHSAFVIQRSAKGKGPVPVDASELINTPIGDLKRGLTNNQIEKKVYIIPTELKSDLLRSHRILGDEQSMNDGLRLYDRVMAMYKMITLSVFPAYHARNFASGFWMTSLAGLTNPAHYGNAIRMMQPDRFGGLAKMGHVVTDAVTGQKYTAAEVVEMAQKHRVLEGTFHGEELREFQEWMSSRKGIVKAVAMPFELGRKMGTFIDQSQKLALFMDRIAKGDTASTAASTVMKYLFDYRNLTEFERKFMRRVIPFYTWWRNNIPLQMVEVWRQPGKTAMIGHAARQFEDDRQKLDVGFVPDWIAKRAGIEVKKIGNTHYFFVLDGWLPTADLLKLGDIPNEVLSAMTPFARVPLEMMTNQSFYDRKEIEAFPGDKRRFLGVPLENSLVNVLRNIRMLNEIDRWNRPELSTADKALATFGLRQYPVSAEFAMKTRLAEMGILSSKMNRSLSRLEFQFGMNHPEAVSLRARIADAKQESKLLRARILEQNPEAFMPKEKRKEAAGVNRR